MNPASSRASCSSIRLQSTSDRTWLNAETMSFHRRVAWSPRFIAVFALLIRIMSASTADLATRDPYWSLWKSGVRPCSGFATHFSTNLPQVLARTMGRHPLVEL